MKILPNIYLFWQIFQGFGDSYVDDTEIFKNLTAGELKEKHSVTGKKSKNLLFDTLLKVEITFEKSKNTYFGASSVKVKKKIFNMAAQNPAKHE